jgi:hypothetical protein
MALISNQTSITDYLRDRPYLIKIFISLVTFALMASYYTYASKANLDRYHIEHTLVGGLLMFTALNIGFSESFGTDRSFADRWYSVSTTLVTGCTIGGFLTLVVLRGIIKLDPASGAHPLLIYAFSLIFGAGLAMAARFHQNITSRCLLLFSSIIAAQLIGCHLDGTFSLLIALLVGLFHQLFIALYDNYRSYVELIERGLMTGSLLTSNIVVLFWLPSNKIWVMHGPFIVRVLAFGYGERPEIRACIALLISSACSIGFLLLMRSMNRPEFAKRYNISTPSKKVNHISLTPTSTKSVSKLPSSNTGGGKIILRP